jgi:hypothetical protein
VTTDQYPDVRKKELGGEKKRKREKKKRKTYRLINTSPWTQNIRHPSEFLLVHVERGLELFPITHIRLVVDYPWPWWFVSVVLVVVVIILRESLKPGPRLPMQTQIAYEHVATSLVQFLCECQTYS